MVAWTCLEGDRVRLRPWRLPADLAPLLAMNGDPLAMRHFPKTLDAGENEAFAGRMAAHGEAHGFTFWPVELRAGGPLIGVVGLLHVAFAAAFTPAIEIGWRFATAHHGQGLAREAATLALDHGFRRLGLPRIVAFASERNAPSWGLMIRLGMRRGADFDHPRIPPDHLLQPHRCYAITAAEWFSRPDPAGRT